MKSNWELLSIDNIADVKSGKRLPKGHTLSSLKTNYPYIRLVDVDNGLVQDNNIQYLERETKEKIFRYIVSTNDICLAIVGNTIGMIFQIKEKWDNANLTENAARLTNFKSNIVPKYLYYYLISYEGNNEILSRKVGSAQGKLPMYNIKSMEIPLPPLKTQKKIVNILSALDDKIELNRKMNQTLEEMAQALFKSWFVDFDPVHALQNRNGEDLETIASNLGISKEVLELFPSEFEESELGMIPKGWEVEKIENILKRYKAPKRYKKDVLTSYGKTPVFEQGADILLGYHENDGEFEATVKNPMFIFGDHTCIMRLSTIPFSISANVIPLSGLVRNSYWTYYATFGQQTFQEYRRHWSELIVRKIVVVDKNLADTFANTIQPIISKIENNIKEIQTLKKTRDTLLPKLLSGEVVV